jgi:uncharacterized protein YjgD (DUF1641 family)
MVDKIKAVETKENHEDEDDIEPIIEGLMENKDSLLKVVGLMKRVSDAGFIDTVENMTADYMPADIEYIMNLFTSKEFTIGLIKSVNVLSSLIHALSSDKSGDAVKAVMFNTDSIMGAMVSGAKNPESFSIFRLMAMMKDPEITSGLTAVLYALKALGKALRTVQDQEKD